MEFELIVSNALMAGIGAIGSGLLSSVSDITKKTVTENFTQLKNRILSKYGNNEQISEAFTLMKLDPESKKLPELVQKCATELKLDDDPELHLLAKQLLEVLEKESEGAKYINSLNTNNINGGSIGGSINGNHNTGHTITTNYSPREKEN